METTIRKQIVKLNEFPTRIQYGKTQVCQLQNRDRFLDKTLIDDYQQICSSRFGYKFLLQDKILLESFLHYRHCSTGSKLYLKKLF